MTRWLGRFGRLPPFVLLALAILGGVFGLIATRAWGQTVVHDEALTWFWILRPPPNKGLRCPDPNNHVLHSCLAYVSVHVFGESALGLRLPALLGSLLYLVSVYRLGRLLFRDSPGLVFFVLLMSTNPFILDFNVAARGYGLALGLTLYATVEALSWLLKDPPGPTPAEHGSTIRKIALGLALSSAANLSFLFVNAALALCFLAMLWIDAWRAAPERGWARAFRDTRSFVLIGLFTFLALTGVFLYKVRGSDFSASTRSWSDVFDSLVLPTLQHGEFAWPLAPESSWQPLLRTLLGWLVTFGVVGGALYVLCTLPGTLMERQPRLLPPWRRAALLLCAVNSITLLLIAVSNRLLGVLLPSERMGIYLIAFSFLTLIALMLGWVERTRNVPGASWLTLPIVGLLGLLIVQSVSHLYCRHFHTWRYDSATRDAFQALVRHARSANEQEKGCKLRVNAHWLVSPSLRFCQAESCEKVLELGEHGRAVPWHSEGMDFDYYVFCLPVDEPLVSKVGAKIIFQDDFSGCAVGVLGSHPAHEANTKVVATSRQ